jgi:HSP20 family molecular chaperone IbpA
MNPSPPHEHQGHHVQANHHEQMVHQHHRHPSPPDGSWHHHMAGHHMDNQGLTIAPMNTMNTMNPLNNLPNNNINMNNLGLGTLHSMGISNMSSMNTLQNSIGGISSVHMPMHQNNEVQQLPSLANMMHGVATKPQSLTVGLKQGKSHIFFTHYLYVRLQLESTLTKSCVYAIYRHMMPDEYKYDYANFSNALYDWIYIEVFKQPNATDIVEETLKKFELVKTTKVKKSGKSERTDEDPPRKRQRKKKTPEDITKEKFKIMLRNSAIVLFTALKPIDQLEHDKFTEIKPDHVYTQEQLQEWEMAPETADMKPPKPLRVPLTYAVKEDETQYIVFANVPCFEQGTLSVWATNTQILLEGTIALPSVVSVAGKQVQIDQLQDVEVAPKQNQLHLGRVRQVIDLPKPINSTCTVGHEGGLVIVVVEKQIYSINKTVI